MFESPVVQSQTQWRVDNFGVRTICGTKHRKNCECCPVSLLIFRSQRLSWIQVLKCHKSLGLSLSKIVLNCKILVKWSTNIKIVKIVIIVKLSKIANNVKNLPKLSKIVTTCKTNGKSKTLSKCWSGNVSSFNTGKMSQRSHHRSLGSLFECQVVKSWVPQSLTRSPIDLFWTAKNWKYFCLTFPYLFAICLNSHISWWS